MSYDLDPEARTTLLENAALSGPATIGGFSLRAVTSATWSLLLRLDNPFITGKQDADYTFAVWSFVYLHSRPITDIHRRVAQLEDLKADIYAFMDEQAPAEMFQFLPWITDEVQRVAATVTKSQGGGTTDPKA